MCGIFGVVGNGSATDVLIQGLHRLKYRGYDSAGVATQVNGAIQTRRASGKLQALEEVLQGQPLPGQVGIGHTRWATHGQPTVTNAHPHVCGPVAVVHNGIIENHRDLRDMLQAQGHHFKSQTDSEVIPHLIHHFLQQDMEPLDAVRTAVASLHGSYALGIMIAGLEEHLIAARRNSPLVIAEGHDGLYLASDAMAVRGTAQDVIYLEDNDIAVVSEAGIKTFCAEGYLANRLRETLNGGHSEVDKGSYQHYMLKEIYEQPVAVKNTLGQTVKLKDKSPQLNNNKDNENPWLKSSPSSPENTADDSVGFAAMNRLHIVACGTSYYAGAVAKYWFERYAKLPVELDIASEFRYRSTPLMKGDAALFISQSGETADTLAALGYVRKQGAEVLSIVNVPTSSIARESDGVFCTQAGPEIGVASTKAFTTQLSLLAEMAIRAGVEREVLSNEESDGLNKTLASVPRLIEIALHSNPLICEMAEQFQTANSALYLGRGHMFPIALEGALKLKEISYIHAEGYAAGELKHGPIALVDKDTPVVMLAPDDELAEKT
ncbi:glutamine--fructose-6-phosphate transaminase (isomerizing), partial [Pseudomonadota bacterium]